MKAVTSAKDAIQRADADALEGVLREVHKSMSSRAISRFWDRLLDTYHDDPTLWTVLCPWVEEKGGDASMPGGWWVGMVPVTHRRALLLSVDHDGWRCIHLMSTRAAREAVREAEEATAAAEVRQ